MAYTAFITNKVLKSDSGKDTEEEKMTSTSVIADKKSLMKKSNGWLRGRSWKEIKSERQRHARVEKGQGRWRKRVKEDEEEVLVTKKLKKDKAGEEDLAKKSNLKEDKEGQGWWTGKNQDFIFWPYAQFPYYDFDLQCKIKKIFHFLLFPHSKIFIPVEKLSWKHSFSFKLGNLLLLFARLLILKCIYVIKFIFQNKEIGQLNKMLISVFVFINLKSNLKCATMGQRFQNMKVTKSSEISYTLS